MAGGLGEEREVEKVGIQILEGVEEPEEGKEALAEKEIGGPGAARGERERGDGGREATVPLQSPEGG